MFGYVTPLKPELKIKEFNQFRSYYCGLCFSIKENFGNIPRMALNYDMTFLALLLDGLCLDNLDVKMKRCMAHPTNKKPVVLSNSAIRYAASMNVALFYYKLLDDKNDENSLKSKFSLLALSPYKKKFTNDIDKINLIIKDNLKILSDMEKNKSFSSIDEICDPFSKIVAEILSKFPYKLKDDSDEIRYNLYNLGYSLGKWIYLIDALDDLKEDMEKKKFNPINFLYNTNNHLYNDFINEIKDRIEFSILNCACSCKEFYDKLPIKRNNAILENIISLGMMDKYINIINGCNCNKKGSEFTNESL